MSIWSLGCSYACCCMKIHVFAPESLTGACALPLAVFFLLCVIPRQQNGLQPDDRPLSAVNANGLQG